MWIPDWLVMTKTASNSSVRLLKMSMTLGRKDTRPFCDRSISLSFVRTKVSPRSRKSAVRVGEVAAMYASERVFDPDVGFDITSGIVFAVDGDGDQRLRNDIVT